MVYLRQNKCLSFPIVHPPISTISMVILVHQSINQSINQINQIKTLYYRIRMFFILLILYYYYYHYYCVVGSSVSDLGVQLYPDITKIVLDLPNNRFFWVNPQYIGTVGLNGQMVILYNHHHHVAISKLILSLSLFSLRISSTTTPLPS